MQNSQELLLSLPAWRLLQCVQTATIIKGISKYTTHKQQYTHHDTTHTHTQSRIGRITTWFWDEKQDVEWCRSLEEARNVTHADLIRFYDVLDSAMVFLTHFKLFTMEFKFVGMFHPIKLRHEKWVKKKKINSKPNKAAGILFPLHVPYRESGLHRRQQRRRRQTHMTRAHVTSSSPSLPCRNNAKRKWKHGTR